MRLMCEHWVSNKNEPTRSFFHFFLIFADGVNVPVINHFPWQMHVFEINVRSTIYIALLDESSSSRTFYRRRGNKCMCIHMEEGSSENKWINSFNWKKSFFFLSFGIEGPFFENHIGCILGGVLVNFFFKAPKINSGVHRHTHTLLYHLMFSSHHCNTQIISTNAI